VNETSIGRTRGQTAWAAADLALFFLLLEVMKAYRSSQWCGTTLQDAAGILTGLAGYFLALYMAIFILASILRRLRLSQQFALPIAAFLSGAVIWFFLSRFREFTPTLDDVIVLAGLLALCAGMLAAPFLKRISTPGFCTLAAAGLAGGLAAVAAAGYYFLFNAHRAVCVTLAPLVWLGVAAAGGLIVWRLAASRGRVAWTVLIIALPPVAACVLTRAPAPAADPERPNLLFIISDALRADYLSAYGGPVPTPHLDALARRGVLFEESYSLAPWTMPSMSAMFSSNYPPGLTPQVRGDLWLTQIWQYGVNPEVTALAERLRERGYATGALTANALLWSMPGIMDGFEVQARSHPILLAQEGFFNHLPFLQEALSALCPALDGRRPHDTTADMNHYAAAYLRRFRDRPFFLWIHYIDPHAPCDPPDRFRTRDGPWPFFYPYQGGEAWGIPLLSPDFQIASEDQPYVRSLYEGEIRYIDESVGRLLDRLDSLDLSENTYVCFTSDHGEELWDHGDWGHGHTVYQELVRVPLMFAGPGIPRRAIDTPISAVDLFPTFADLLGTPPENVWRGRSLARVLQGEARPPDQPIFAQGTSNRAWPEPLQMVLDGNYKLIREAGSGKARLFAIRNDPGETKDLAAELPDQVQALTEKMTVWLKSFNAAFKAPENIDVKLDPQQLETLRGMGYL